MRDLVLAHVARSLFDQPHAVLPEKLREIVGAFGRRQNGLPSPPDANGLSEAREKGRELRAVAIGATLREVEGLTVDQVGRVAVLPLYGTVVQRPGVFTQYSGGTSAEQFAAAHAALVADRGVRAVVWDVDSPGGSVAGVPESAARLAASKRVKRTVALSNTLMASAAYWLASAADEVVSAPSALTGSIGVVAVHEDRSKANEAEGVAVNYIHAGKYKVEGHPDAPLTDEARAAVQQTVDDYYDMFVRAVSKQRNATEAAVRGGFGEGRVLTARRAVAANLADRVATLPQVLRQLGAYDP